MLFDAHSRDQAEMRTYWLLEGKPQQWSG
jgi:hypothetical protein